MGGYLIQAFIYLCAAVIAVPIAKRLGLGSVLGYLIAGIVIGPIIGLVGSEAQEIQHFAEFGVVMMLFLVGLELEPSMLWSMRNRLLGLGGLQVGVTTALFAAAGLAFDLEAVQAQLSRRRPGQGTLTSPRKEKDEVQVLSGLDPDSGKTLGTSIAMLVINKDAKSKDYSNLAKLYRPSHADYTYQAKFGLRAVPGGGRASARETISIIMM